MKAILLVALCLGTFVSGASADESEDRLNRSLQGMRAKLREQRERAFRHDLPGKPAELMAVAQDADRPEAERLEALRSLRAAALKNSEVLKFLRQAASEWESPALRERAVQSLGFVPSLKADSKETIELLKNIAENDGSLKVRAMAFKALHWATANHAEIRDWMVSWATEGDPLPLRRAALWALQSSCDVDAKVKATLISAFQNESSVDLRETALRSLYPLAGTGEVRNLALEAAQNKSEDKDLRFVATLFLGTVPNRDLVRSDLEDLASPAEKDSSIRLAAKWALLDDNGPDMRQIHRARFDPVIHVMLEVMELE